MEGKSWQYFTSFFFDTAKVWSPFGMFPLLDQSSDLLVRPKGWLTPTPAGLAIPSGGQWPSATDFKAEGGQVEEEAEVVREGVGDRESEAVADTVPEVVAEGEGDGVGVGVSERLSVAVRLAEAEGVRVGDCVAVLVGPGMLASTKRLFVRL